MFQHIPPKVLPSTQKVPTNLNTVYQNCHLIKKYISVICIFVEKYLNQKQGKYARVFTYLYDKELVYW